MLLAGGRRIGPPPRGACAARLPGLFHTSRDWDYHTEPEPGCVDTSATFNNSNANLRPRFDNNAQVTAGSFSINGTSITVNANDSISSVIGRVNTSGAGVTASFANGKLTLATSAASEDHIYLSNDTSLSPPR